MKILMKMLKVFSLILVLFGVGPQLNLLFAEDTPSSTEATVEDDDVIRRPKPSPAVPKVFTKEEIKKVCKKYEGQTISIYGEFFSVKNCLRMPILESDEIYTLQKRGKTIHEVSAADVAAIPISPEPDRKTHPKRGCKELEGRFVTVSFMDVYGVEKCKRRLVPDWETYIALKKKRQKSTDVLALTYEEFGSLAQGTDYPSTVDQEFASIYPKSTDVDIIPIDEACKGIEGKTLSFYSRIYKIEKCKKREIDPETFSKMNYKGTAPRLKELTSEQWVSLPDGPPLGTPNAKPKLRP